MKFLIVCFLLFTSQIIMHAQDDLNKKFTTDTLKINFSNLYSISDVSIIPNSELIRLGKRILSHSDYVFNYQRGTFSLSDSLSYSVFDTLIVSYLSFRTGLQKIYQKRSLVIRYDEEGKDTVRIAQTSAAPLSVESIFGSGLEKSGTLVRGFTVGTTKDFSLQSGLRLQLSGRLSDEIEIVAALTDENTPIQPEGNTERLEELDKVFIQLKHPLASGTFGDYQLQKKTGEFGYIDRKLQGLLGEFSYQAQDIKNSTISSLSSYVSLASSRGKFNTNYFTGIEGVQGPYRLAGGNNERDIIVIAGTERVYLDGIEMKRGEANDYTIEYANAEVTFTPNRLITSSSRITIDFEYTDRRYSRNFFGAGTGSSFFNNKFSVQFQYLREADNQDAPIDIALTDEDKNILASAGDNRYNAVKTGISMATPDSAGAIKGTYEKIDTLINGQPVSIYRYNPGNINAVYNVSFNYVGEGQGDYIRESIGNYRFAGPGQGNFLPLIFLPLPELRQQGNIVLNASPSDDLVLSLELAGSLWDKNRFSNINDNDNGGYARNIFLQLKPVDVNIGNTNFGKAGFSYRDRYIQNRYTSLDRINEIEFNRYYNVNTEIPENEQLREISLNLLPVKQLNITSSLGILKRGENFKSNRYNNTLLYSDSTLNLNYNFDYVESVTPSVKSYWLRQRGTGSYIISILNPGIEFIHEDRKDKSPSDSIIQGSYRYYEVNPFIGVNGIQGLNLLAKYSYREDFLPVQGILFKESKTITQYYQADYTGSQAVNTSLNITIRNKKFTEEYKTILPQAAADNQTILVRSQSRFNFIKPLTGDLYYEVSTQRAAKLQRVFIQVARGNGQYIYMGDINNNGVKDEYEFEPAVYDADYIVVTIPTDELYPVIDLKTSTRWRVNFNEVFENNDGIGSLFKPLSAETFVRIEENSRESNYWKIYLLKFSAFQNEVNTIYGSNYFQQDLFLWENDQELSFRLRYSQNRSLNQYSAGVERNYLRERSLRIRFRLIKEIANQTDLVNTTDNASATVFSNRRREISGNSLSTDFSYRPENYIEIGFRIKVENRIDRFPVKPTNTDINSLLLRMNLSFQGRGRLRAEVERSELVSNTTENYLPFELTSGDVVGKNYYWRVNFDYRIASNLQSSLGYDGRLQGTGKVINTLRAEARAYF